jgi:hypothetical protein
MLSAIAPQVDTGGRYFFSRKKKSRRTEKQLALRYISTTITAHTDDKNHSRNSMNRRVDPRRDPEELRSLRGGRWGTAAFRGEACHIGDDESGREKDQAPLFQRVSE